MRRVARILAYFIATLVAIFVALCVAGEIRQRRLVHRAQRLMDDVHALRLHQSTWADAERLITRWGRWGRYEGQCTQLDCMYVVTLDNGMVYDNNVAEWPSRVKFIVSAFRLLPRQWGGGLRQLQGMFLVQDGLIVRSGLALDMTASPWAKGAQNVCCGDELIISVLSRSSLSTEWQPEGAAERHPDYRVWRPGGCTFCLMGRVTYAQSISSEAAAQLSGFQLSCATRWSSCLTLEQLDPSARAWHLYGPPWGEAPDREEPRDLSELCHRPVYARARDAQLILIVEPRDDSREEILREGEPSVEKTVVRVIGAEKGDKSSVNATLEIITYGQEIDGKQGMKPVSLKQGKRYYLFADAPDPTIPESLWSRFHPVGHFGPCEVEMATPQSEAEIRRGVHLNDSLRGDEPSVSLTGFARHKRGLFDE